MAVVKLPRSIAITITIIMATAAWSCSYTDPIWIPRAAKADPLFRFVRNRKAGYINAQGEVVIPPKLHFSGNNSGEEFLEGLLQPDSADWIDTFLDTKGRKIRFKHAEDAGGFSEGLTAARPKGSKFWGFIDKAGKFVIPPQFSGPSGIGEFHEGYADITVDGKVGFIDRSGKFVIQPTFILASAFSEGFARVVTDGPCMYDSRGACSGPLVYPYGSQSKAATIPLCKFTFVDATGRIITDQRFDDAGAFAEGLAPVRVGKLWGYIDASGSWKIRPQFELGDSFSNGVALVQQAGLFGYIRHDGTYEIQPRFKVAEHFVDGRAVVTKDEGYVIYIDHSGKQAFPGEFAVGSSFFKGLAHVELLPGPGRNPSVAGWAYAYIDKSGRRVFSYHVDPPRDGE